jgi:enoyl-CoA hydratase/carnithine racemase
MDIAKDSSRTGYSGNTMCLEWPRPHVALVTFTRPQERNAMSLEMVDELRAVIAHVTSQRPAALVLTGQGRAFCAGADLKMIASPDAEFFTDAMAFRDKFLAPLALLLDQLEELPFPVIAAINGFALGGGCELALSCDLRLMAPGAELGMPEVSLGATCGAGGVQKMIRHVGRSKALEWILLGSRISAEQAEDAGLLVSVVEAERLVEAALDLAQRFTGMGPRAVAQSKVSVYMAEDADLRSARRFGVEALTALASTDEWHEGVRAFVEKRKPRFWS